ncbi:MAG: DUF559 domain-containing protein [Acidobacteriota bacterium]|nr:DUF559 domain-containing protein [Acidobacteriota bacterium]
MHPSMLARWTRSGYLQRVLPKVYAVGHAAPNREASLWAAVLYAGPGAMLSHATNAHWRGLIDYPPSSIQVSSPSGVRSLPGIKVYGRRTGLVRELHKGIPVTTIPVTMVDLAATAGPRVVHRALGQLDFQKLLDVDSLLGACGNGRSGAAALREAIAEYDPRYKYANGRLEEDFYDMCKRCGLPLPVLNTYVHNIKCDAYWPRQGLVVELDSELAHSSSGQRRRDRRNDLTLRSHGLTVLRYDWDLVHEQPDAVCRDVLRMLERLVAERRVAERLVDERRGSRAAR